MSDVVMVAWIGFAGVVVTAISTAWVAYARGKGSGKREGALGKKEGFQDIENGLSLHDTRWHGEYEEADGNGKTMVNPGGIVEFEQFGSRIVGEGRDGDRTWILEGATSGRHLCYVYIDRNQSTKSFGTGRLELNGAGDVLAGTWAGWSPTGESLAPQRLTLTKIKQ